MFSFTSLSILSLKKGAIYFGSAKRDRDLILFLCSSFSASSLVPRDYGNIFVNNLGKWLRRERRIFPSQPLPVRALSSFPYPYTRSSLVSSSRSRLSLREARAGRSFRFRGWVVTTRKPAENKTMKYLHCYVRMCGYSFISQPVSGYIAGYFILPRWRFRGRLVLIGTLAKMKASVSPQFSTWLYFLTPAFLLVAVLLRA